jgi:hypothetical protein
MFIKDVNMKIIRVLNLASVHIEDVEYVDCVQQYFSGRKQQRAYCSTCAVVSGFVLACSLSSAEMLSVE